MASEFNKYELYTSVESKYCYKETSILKNKLGTKDFDKLKEAEIELSFLRLESLTIKNITGKFTVNQLKSLKK